MQAAKRNEMIFPRKSFGSEQWNILRFRAQILWSILAFSKLEN